MKIMIGKKYALLVDFTNDTVNSVLTGFIIAVYECVSISVEVFRSEFLFLRLYHLVKFVQSDATPLQVRNRRGREQYKITYSTSIWIKRRK